MNNKNKLNWDNKLKYNKKIHNKICSTYNSKHKEIYNDYEQNRLSWCIDNLLELSPTNEPYVLDIWSWTWNLTKFFLEKNCNIVSSDVSKKSLDYLEKRFNYNKKLSTKIITWEDLPFDDNIFDITVTYSVLHHIPDYLNTVKEMIRVTKSWWIIFIDHELNENKWNNSIILQEYYNLCSENLITKLKRLFVKLEIFDFKKWYSFFIVKFINPRFQLEWDIHVWNDDHIEWNKIKGVLLDNNCEIIKEMDYLLYNINVDLEIFNSYKDKISDTKFLIIKKNI